MTDPVELTDDTVSDERRPDVTFLAISCVVFITIWVMTFTEWAL